MICLNIFEDTVMQSLKGGKTRKVASFPCRSKKNLRIYSRYSLPDLKYDQKRFIRIPSLKFLETRPWSTFQLILSNGCHGNDDRYKNIDYSFRYAFPRSITVQKFIKWQEKKLSVIKIVEFLFLTTLKEIKNRDIKKSWLKYEL